MNRMIEPKNRMNARSGIDRKGSSTCRQQSCKCRLNDQDLLRKTELRQPTEGCFLVDLIIKESTVQP